LVYLYANNAEEQYTYIEAAKERGYDVLLMDGVLDNHFINAIEHKFEKTVFTRVDADVIDKLIQKEDALPSKLSQEEQDKLKPIIENSIPKDKFSLVFESLSETDQPVITQPEYMRRMKDMSAMGGGMSYMGELPDHYNMVINTNHPVIGKILNETDESLRTNLIKQVTDLALLSQSMLKGEDLTNFIKRSVEIIK